MKRKNTIGNCIDRSEAVSEIISAVLMVSLVVVGIAVISVFIMGQDTPIEIPSLSMIPGTDNTDLLLYHSGGDSLKRGEFLVRVDGLNYYSNEINLIGQDGGVESANSWDSWDVGETLEIPGKSDYNQVLIISTVGGQESLITGSGEAVITGTGTPTATQTTTPGPVAGFTANITSGYAPLSVLFTDQSTGSPTSWLWSFGDGGTSTGQNPVHEYSSTGLYNVSLTVSNAYGTDFEIKIGYINVSTIIPPAANFTATPTSGDKPLNVSFTDLSTGSPTSWFWEFGDGYNSTGQNPVHTYTSAGSYTVSLSASNSAGSDIEIKTEYITVSISFAEYIVSENVFVYGSQLSMDGRTITGEGSTIVIQDGGLKNSDLDGETRIAVSNIYIDGPVTLIGQNGALGSPVSPGIIAVNGNVYLSYFGSIYGDLYIDGDLTLLGNTINGDIYVNGDLTLYDSFPSFGSADSKIYYTGALSCPASWDSSKRSRFVKVDSVPIVGMPDMEIPSAKESDWYTSRGYVSGGTLESNMKIYANSYSFTDWIPGGIAENVVIVASTGDITIRHGGIMVTGLLFAPNGKVTFDGGHFEGLVIAKDGFFVKDGGTRVIFKNMDQYIVNPEDYPF